MNNTTRRRWYHGAVFALTAVSAAGLGATPATAADGDGHVEPYIVGGEPAPVAYAGIGSLQLAKNGHKDWHSCGVMRISKRFAITAAHCVSQPDEAPSRRSDQGNDAWRAFQVTAPTARAEQEDQPDPSDPAQYTIRFGSVDRFAGGMTRSVRSITLPEHWAWGKPDKKGRVWDIALLDTRGDQGWTKPGQVAFPRSSEPAKALGWGMTDPDPAHWGAPAPARLMQLEVPITQRSECAQAGIGTAEICLGTAPNGGTACAGDSGSGAIQRFGRHWYMVGLVSRSHTQACVAPTVYTEIAPYADWIIRKAFEIDRSERISQADLALVG